MRGGLGAANDAALVAAARDGDRAAFAAIYDRYADRLHDFCWSMLRNREEAADATHDAFVLAAERLGQLRDPERLRPWLYAVARSQSLRRLRVRDRVIDKDGEQDMAAVADPGTGPEGVAEQADLQRLVWDAAAGLGDRDRAVLDLHLRQGLEGAELGEAMGVPASHAYVLPTRVRDQVERSLGALLIARMGREDCVELEQILQDWDGRFSPLIRKRVARHMDGCRTCGDRRRTMVSPLALLSAVPLMPAPASLRDRVLASVSTPGGPPDGGGRGGAQDGGALAAVGLGGASWPPDGAEPPRTGSRAGVLALVVLLALLVGGVAAVVLPGSASTEEEGGQAAAPPGPTAPAATSGTTAPVVEPSLTTVAETTAAPTITTIAAAAATTTSTTSPTTTTATLPPPVQVGISPGRIVLAPTRPRAVITLTNPNRRRVAWEAVASDLWFTVGPTGGTIGAGGEAKLTASYNPTAVKPPADGSVLITWDGGQGRVEVVILAPVPASTTPPTKPPTRPTE